MANVKAEIAMFTRVKAFPAKSALALVPSRNVLESGVARSQPGEGRGSGGEVDRRIGEPDGRRLPAISVEKGSEKGSDPFFQERGLTSFRKGGLTPFFVPAKLASDRFGLKRAEIRAAGWVIGARVEFAQRGKKGAESYFVFRHGSVRPGRGSETRVAIGNICQRC